MKQQLSCHCHAYNKLKSCSVWCFFGKKNSGDMGAFGPPPVGGSAPYTPLKKQKWQKSAIFGLLYFCPSTLTPPHHKK